MNQNFAFISYNHKDVKHAQWIQKKLENYKLPAEIHNEFEDTRFIRPVFRDQTDLNTGVLANVLRDQLEASKYLIVLCSPNSAKSQWVSNEVKTFIEWGRLDKIIPVIVEGQPNCYNPDLECFPEYLRQYTKEHPEAELLGISFAEVGKEKAFVRIVSKMLDVSFDTLWKRYERHKRIRRIQFTLLTVVILSLLYWFALPYQFAVHLHDDQHQLPIIANDEGSVGTLTVNNVDYALQSLDTTVQVGWLPGYYRMRTIDVSFNAAYYYQSVNNEVKLGSGFSSEMDIQLQRDNTFGLLAGKVVDAESLSPLEGVLVTVDNGEFSATTGADGRFEMNIPLEKQTVYKDIELTCTGYKSDAWPEETISDKLEFKLYKDR